MKTYRFLLLTTSVWLIFSNNLFGQWENVYEQPDVKLTWLNAMEFRDFNNGFKQ